jgi:hypothetical protein
MADQRYLNVLAESYKNASSWETRKQILSIMTDLASYSVISSFISGITKYRYTAANLHRLQFGRGVPVPAQTSVRVRVDLKQLDHFLSFITSPHLVQDLPFGQNKVNIYDMVWKPFVLGDCVPSAGSWLKNALSFYCFDNSQFRQLGVRNGYQLFVLPIRAISYGIFCQ